MKILFILPAILHICIEFLIKKHVETKLDLQSLPKRLKLHMRNRKLR